MTPSYAIKKGVRYRYYVSSALLQGCIGEAGSVPRIASQDIEDRVVAALRARGLFDSSSVEVRESVQAVVDRITVTPTEITIAPHAGPDQSASTDPVRIPWTPPIHTRRRSLEPPAGAEGPPIAQRARGMRAEARARLLIAIATARDWLDQLVRTDVPDLAELAHREKRSERSVRMILSGLSRPMRYVALNRDNLTHNFD